MIENCPDEILLYMLLQKLPGYTRELLEEEPAQLVERWLICLQEEGKEAKRQAEKSKHAGKRGR